MNDFADYPHMGLVFQNHPISLLQLPGHLLTSKLSTLSSLAVKGSRDH